MTKVIKVIPEILSDEKFETIKNNNKRNYAILSILIIYVLLISIYIFKIDNELKLLYTEVEAKNTENQYLKSEIFKLQAEQLKLEEAKKAVEYDFETDSSLQKFVTSNISFNEKSYIPSDLVSFSWTYIIDSKWNWELRSEAMENLKNLNKAFYEYFWRNLVVVSSYRSYEYQVWIKSRGCPDNLCAKAWFSEHQSWLAIDLFEASTNYNWKNNSTLNKYYVWLDENAHKYWFHNTYQRWLKIDWYEIEPWHWRYLWVDFATYLKEKNLTIAEYYNSLEK